ncbi:hypothetical protein LX36DRAFT_659228 [Colletotrichum falcatum]|nr:hypothetical protein LX36DRAFT_659228 [Colletotrichum falcatum]
MVGWVAVIVSPQCLLLLLLLLHWHPYVRCKDKPQTGTATTGWPHEPKTRPISVRDQRRQRL